MTADPPLLAVAKAGRKFARAQKARDDARDELFAALREADASGDAPRPILADIAGVARQTVYDALRAQPDQASGR